MNVSRSATRTGSVSSSTPPERSRSSTTSACASPMHHSTSWRVSGLRSSRMVGSPATRRPRFLASASSSERVLATMATGSSGSGMSHGPIRSGLSFVESVSPVSAVLDLVIAQMSPATHVGHLAQLAAERGVEVGDPLVGVVVGVAARLPCRGRTRARWSPGAACRRRPGPATPGRRRSRWSS